MTAQEIVEARAKCKTDPVFLADQLGYDITESPHRAMFDALASGKKKRLVLWPRGTFKTSCVVVYLVQRILQNPDIRILIMQATLKLTKGWLAEIKTHFNGQNNKSTLPEIFPEFCGKDLGDALTFTVPARTRKHLREATVTAASPRASSTGQHYTLMAFDDLVNDQNFRNVDLLDKLESQYNHFLPLLDPGGDVLMTGTRYSHADLYARILKKDAGVEEWEKSIRECWDASGVLLFPQRPSKDGTRLLGFTTEILSSLQRGDPEMFAPQYLNRIVLSGHQRFPESLVLGAVKASKDPEYPSGAPCYFFIDLATSTKPGADDRVITIGRQDSRGRVWIADCFGSTWSISQLVSVVLQQVLIHRPARVFVEKQPGAEFFQELLRVMSQERGVNVVSELVPGSRQKGAKDIRVESLESFLKTGKLFFCAGIHDFDKLVEEFTQWPHGRHDDRPDCIGLLVGRLTGLHFPTAPTFPAQSPWFVRAVLDDMAAQDQPTCKSLCGDGFN